MKKNIIITGGSGQDAKILSQAVKNYKINFLIKKKDKYFSKKRNVNYSKINLLEYKSIYSHIKKTKPLAIIHLASKNNSTNKKKQNYNLDYKKNLLMTKNLILAIKDNNKKIKFIFAGSSLMFKKKKGIVTEESKFEATCLYSKYKIDSHKLIIKYKKKYGLNACSAILFNHDSIHRNKKFLLPRIIRYLKNKNFKKINEIYKENIYGDFSHAEDICQGMLRLIKLKKMPDKIILSSNKLSSINTLIRYGLNLYNYKTTIRNDIKIKKNLLVGNNSFAKKILHWSPKKNVFLAFKELLNKT